MAGSSGSLTAKDVESVLRGAYPIQQNRYVVSNIYLFRWESDFLVQSRAGITYEFEIKVSRSDFFADFKKDEKHQALPSGLRKTGTTRFVNGKPVPEPDLVPCLRPNFFYYVVPEGLVQPLEVPAYAGLAYVRPYSPITIVKKAPKLHPEKLVLEPLLCEKFYIYFNQRRQRIIQLEYDVDSLKRKINQLEAAKNETVNQL